MTVIKPKSDTPATTPEPTENLPPPTWSSLNLSSDLLDLIQKAGFEKPTPIQAQTIPWAMEGRDIIASAQTGTGKTAAFVFPLLERLKGREGTYGLVLAPSREIALQTKAVLDTFGTPLGIRSACLIGGIDFRYDLQAINTYPQILVATPGRLCDHLDRGNLWLDYLEFVILDEADRMLDMGFSDQLNRILADTPKTRQTMIFSATMPAPVEKLAHRILSSPQRISIGKPVTPATSVDQFFIFTDDESKTRQLLRLLEREPGTVFIFTRSKIGATQLWRSLRSRGFYDATHLHSDLRQCDREQALADFKEGKYRVMIATDVIGRGIHVEGVAHVVNYDLPRDTSDYVHRIGRTGRADAKGKATSFVTKRDRIVLREIEELLGRAIEMDQSEQRAPRPSGSPAPLPRSSAPNGQPNSPQGESSQRRRRRRRPRGGGGSSAPKPTRSS